MLLNNQSAIKAFFLEYKVTSRAHLSILGLQKKTFSIFLSVFKIHPQKFFFFHNCWWRKTL